MDAPTTDTVGGGPPPAIADDDEGEVLWIIKVVGVWM
jgi:hypothetical protein